MSSTPVKAVAVGLLLLMVGACENSVDPFIDTDRYFSIFGYLDTGSDTQYVRVIPFRKEIGAVDPQPLDAVVTATEVESGVEYTWRDSIITFDDGSAGHVFVSDFRPVPGRTYVFRVEREDGAASWAETRVPPAEDVLVEPPPPFAQGAITQLVTWEDIEAPPLRVEVWYRFSEYPPHQPFTEFKVTYDDIGKPVQEDWQVRVNLSEDTDGFKPLLRPGSPLMGVGMRLTMSDDAWRPPGGIFNEEILVQPGTFSNVEHGFGFLGAVNQYTVEWVLDPSVIERLGFSPPR